MNSILNALASSAVAGAGAVAAATAGQVRRQQLQQGQVHLLPLSQPFCVPEAWRTLCTRCLSLRRDGKEEQYGACGLGNHGQQFLIWKVSGRKQLVHEWPGQLLPLRCEQG